MRPGGCTPPSKKIQPRASPEEYLQCIDHYQQVYRLDPHFGGSDDAVFESGTALPGNE